MKRIGITQRVVHVSGRSERRDVLDQRWYEFAAEAGMFLIPVPNKLKKPEEFAIELGIEGLIFSGGNNIGNKNGKPVFGLSLEENDYAAERDFTEASLMEWAMKSDIPLVGVCRGMQFINGYLGGALVPVKSVEHVATMHPIEFRQDVWMEMYGNQQEFNSFHDWGIANNTLANDLIQTGTVGSYTESFVHMSLNICGIMWHPERYNHFKQGDLKLFCKTFQIL
jgi:N5-(cytidine 5'-diphosphoramidyl)-L-glutamine hydrolase